MKEIKLTKGKSALVDDEDFDELNKYKWHFKTDGYAARNFRLYRGKRTTIRMHQFILVPPTGMVTDHKDRNKLNNQKSNLRICTRSQNGMNRKKNINGVSKFKGVSPSIKGKYKYYISTIFVNGKTIWGAFPYTSDGEIAAAKHYNEMANKHFGEFAHLNNFQ